MIKNLAEYYRDDSERIDQRGAYSPKSSALKGTSQFRSDGDEAPSKSSFIPRSAQNGSREKSIEEDRSDLSFQPKQGLSRASSATSGFIPISIGDREEEPPLPAPTHNMPVSLGWLDEIVDQTHDMQDFQEPFAPPTPRSPEQASKGSPPRPFRRMPSQASDHSAMSASSKPSPLDNRPELTQGTWSTSSSPTLGRFPSLFRNFKQEKVPKRPRLTRIPRTTGNTATFPNNVP